MLVLVTATVAGCGSGSHFANRARPAAPVNLTVYVNDHRISVSPGTVGAGPVIFIITNQASNAESLAVLPTGGAAVADTGPISPQGTAQLTVNLNGPGDYTVAVAANGATQAAAATPTGIVPGLVHVGSARSNSNSQLLQP
jgi:hypothetical protein